MKIAKKLDINLLPTNNERKGSPEPGDLLSERFKKRHFSTEGEPSNFTSRTGTTNGSRCCNKHHVPPATLN
jgi:hypothetical protein